MANQSQTFRMSNLKLTDGKTSGPNGIVSSVLLICKLLGSKNIGFEYIL